MRFLFALVAVLALACAASAQQPCPNCNGVMVQAPQWTVIQAKPAATPTIPASCACAGGVCPCQPACDCGGVRLAVVVSKPVVVVQRAVTTVRLLGRRR